MSKELCRSQELNVVTKPKQNSRLKEKWCHNKEFSIEALLKKIVKNTVATILDSVATMIKENSKRAMSRQYFLCHNIKR